MLVLYADVHVYVVYLPTFNVRMKKERPRLTRSCLSTSNSYPHSLVFYADAHVYIAYLPTFNVQMSQLQLSPMAEMKQALTATGPPLIKRMKTCTFFMHNLHLSLSLILLSRDLLATAGKADVNSDIEDGGEDGEAGIMSPECQDPLLAQTYLGLPILP